MLISSRDRHYQQPQFVCTLAGCGKRYSARKTYVRHYRTHSSRYFCPVQGCKYAEGAIKMVGLARGDSLPRHMRRAHPQLPSPGRRRKSNGARKRKV